MLSNLVRPRGSRKVEKQTKIDKRHIFYLKEKKNKKTKTAT